ncbi:MAG: hypothetical protein IT162_19835 [Bryobacterales bacterium]|nr:hypothetical protein [Bryobacterales bacterium]
MNQSKWKTVAVAAPVLLGAAADLLLWRLAGPVAEAGRREWSFLSWPRTVPAGARELIGLGSCPFTLASKMAGWRWHDAGPEPDWLAWIACILFWAAFTAALMWIHPRLLKFAIRIGITRLGGAVALQFAPWGLYALPLLQLQWILLGMATLLTAALRVRLAMAARQSTTDA